MAANAEPTPILAHLFLGSKAHARDRALLEKLQITHILNVTPPKTVDPVAGVPNFFEKDKKLIYRRCPIFDNKAEDISGVLEGCVAFMDQAKYYGRILVHCNKGISRSTSMVAAYLMKIKGMSFDEALQFVTEKRPVANPNASFRRQLQEYCQKLRRTTAASSKGKSAIGAAVRGPQGPSLPPTQSGEKTKASSPKDSDRGSIGPQLPPHLQKKTEEEGDNLEDGEQVESETNSVSRGNGGTAVTTEVIGEEELVAIGPSQSGKKTKVSSPKKKTQTSIGPQLPPHLQKKVEKESDLEDGIKGNSETNGASNGGGVTATSIEVVAEELLILGPSFPRSHKRPHHKATEDSDEAASSPRKKTKTVKEEGS